MKDTRPLSEPHQYLLLGVMFGVVVAICLIVVLSEDYSDHQRILAAIIGILCTKLMIISLLASWITRHNKKVYPKQSSSGKTKRKDGRIHYQTDIHQHDQVSEQLRDNKEEIEQEQ